MVLKYANDDNPFYSFLILIGIVICLASWGWLYRVSFSNLSGVSITTPIKVTDTLSSEQPQGEETVHIRVSNNSDGLIRVVGFSARCTCVERLFELPQELASGDEVSLAVKIHLPLPEGGAPAHLFIEQEQTVSQEHIQFEP